MTLQNGGEDVSLLQERFSQLIEAEVDRRLEAEAALRSERERQQRELLLLEKEQVPHRTVPYRNLLTCLLEE